MLKVTGISEEQLLVTVLPGFPTTAEIFVVPEKTGKHGSVDEKRAHVDQVIPLSDPRCKTQTHSVKPL